MVRDGKMFVVLLHGAVEYPRAIGRVVQARVEVCVVADVKRNVISDTFERNKTYFLKLIVLFEDCGVWSGGEKYVLNVLSHNAVNGSAECGEGIQGRFAEDALEGLDGGE